MAFWRDATGAEPKRKQRFLIRFTNAAGDELQSYYASKISKPEISVNPVELKYLGHTYKYPGNVTWSESTAEFIDVDRSSLAFLKRLSASGYNPLVDPNHTTTISKDKAVGALGPVEIISLGANPVTPTDANNARELDIWTLGNAWISKLSFGEADYESDEIMKISVTFVYDWAEYNSIEYGEIIWPL